MQSFNKAFLEVFTEDGRRRALVHTPDGTFTLETSSIQIYDFADATGPVARLHIRLRTLVGDNFPEEWGADDYEPDAPLLTDETREMLRESKEARTFLVETVS